MKFKWFTAIALTAMAITSCSEDTEGIGASLTDESDKLDIYTGIFTATTKDRITELELQIDELNGRILTEESRLPTCSPRRMWRRSCLMR